MAFGIPASYTGSGAETHGSSDSAYWGSSGTAGSGGRDTSSTSEVAFLNKSRVRNGRTEYLYEIDGREEWTSVKPTGHGGGLGVSGEGDYRTTRVQPETATPMSGVEASIKSSRERRTGRFILESSEFYPPNAGVPIGRYSPTAVGGGVWSDEDLNPATPEKYYTGGVMGLPHSGEEVRGIWSEIKSKSLAVSQDEFTVASNFWSGVGLHETITPYGRTAGIPTAPIFLEKYVDYRKDLYVKTQEYNASSNAEFGIPFTGDDVYRVKEFNITGSKPSGGSRESEFTGIELGGLGANPNVAERPTAGLGTTNEKLGTTSSSTIYRAGLSNDISPIKDMYMSGKDFLTGLYNSAYEKGSQVYQEYAPESWKSKRGQSREEWTMIRAYLESGDFAVPTAGVLGGIAGIYAKTTGAGSYVMGGLYEGSKAIPERLMGFVSDIQYKYAMADMEKSRESFSLGWDLLTSNKRINVSPKAVLKPIPKEDAIVGILKNEATGEESYMTYGQLMGYYKSEGQGALDLAGQMREQNTKAGKLVYNQADIERTQAYGEEQLGKIPTLESKYSNYEREWEFNRDMGVIMGGVLIAGTVLVPIVGGGVSGWTGKELLARAGGYAVGFGTTVGLGGAGTALDVAVFGQPKQGEWRLSGAFINLASIAGGSYVGKKTYTAIQDFYSSHGYNTDAYLKVNKRVDVIAEDRGKAVGLSLEKGRAIIKAPSGSKFNAGEYQLRQDAFYQGEGKPVLSKSVYQIKGTTGRINAITDIPLNPKTGEPLSVSKDLFSYDRQGVGESLSGMDYIGSAKTGVGLVGIGEKSVFISKSRYASRSFAGDTVSKEAGSTLGLTTEKAVNVAKVEGGGILGLESISKMEGFLKGAYQKFTKTITGGRSEQGMSVIGEIKPSGQIYHEGAFTRYIVKLTGEGGGEGGGAGVKVIDITGSVGGGGGSGQIAVSEMVKIIGSGNAKSAGVVSTQAISMGSDIIGTQGGITGSAGSLIGLEYSAKAQKNLIRQDMMPEFYGANSLVGQAVYSERKSANRQEASILSSMSNQVSLGQELITGGRSRRRYRSETDVISGQAYGSQMGVILAQPSGLESLTGQQLEVITGSRNEFKTSQNLEFNNRLDTGLNQITGLITGQRHRYLNENIITHDFNKNFYTLTGGGGGSGGDLIGLSRRKGRKKKLIRNPLASPEEMLGFVGGGVLDGIV